MFAQKSLIVNKLFQNSLIKLDLNICRLLRGSNYKRDFIENIKTEQDTTDNYEKSNNNNNNQFDSEESSSSHSPRRRVDVKNLLNRASTYSDIKTPDPGDPFQTSPYVFGTPKPKAPEKEEEPKIDPEKTSVILFPGQGTQYPGMCGNPNQMSEEVKNMYQCASEILGFNLLDVSLNGPREQLNLTTVCQPAVIVSSLAALEKLRIDRPYFSEACIGTAGFSVGEFTALIFSGVLSFEDAIKIVKVRSEAMHLASEMIPGKMATVLFGADSKLEFGLSVAKEWCLREFNIEEPVCRIANYLFPHCKVIAGHKEAIDFISENYKDFNLRKVKILPVEGAFHTELMRPAADTLKAYLKKINFGDPRVSTYANTTGKKYFNGNQIKKEIVKQIYKPVMWEQIFHAIYQRDQGTSYPTTFECGPGHSLSTVLKMVHGKAFQRSEYINP